MDLISYDADTKKWFDRQLPNQQTTVMQCNYWDINARRKLIEELIGIKRMKEVCEEAKDEQNDKL